MNKKNANEYEKLIAESERDKKGNYYYYYYYDLDALKTFEKSKNGFYPSENTNDTEEDPIEETKIHIC